MEGTLTPESAIDEAIARRLKALRSEAGWSLDELAAKSGVSRATLSRLETAQVSPTTNVLGKLCAAYGLTLSRLMHMVEEGFEPLLRRDAQPVWRDESVGFTRRSVSPPARTLAGEALECEIAPGMRIDYERPPRAGLEHHLVMLSGALKLTVESRAYELKAGDCLRYQLFGESAFETPPRTGAKYLLFMV